jgi:spore maturation protein CgeB
MIPLLTNHSSPTGLALRAAARHLHCDLRALAEFPTDTALRAFAPRGALVFIYGAPEAAEAAVDRLQALDVPVAVWQVDDPQYFRSAELRDLTFRVARKADVYFSHTDQLTDAYRAHGIAVTYLPTGARELPGTDHLIAHPAPEDELEHDWAFVGTLNDARRGFLETLAQRLPKTLCGRVATDVTLDEAYRIYRRSKVTLALPPVSETAAEPSWALTERSWEVPLVGGFLLQDERRHLAQHFGLGTEAVTYASVEDCAAKVVRFVEDDRERRAIATRAQDRVWCEHLLRHRLLMIVRRLLAAKKEVQWT